MIFLNKRTVKFLSLITGVLGIVSLLWLIYDYVMYNRLKSLILQFEDLGSLEKLSEFIWLSYLFMFFFHLLAAGTLVIQMRFIRRIQALSLLAVVTGVFSFLGIFSDWAVFGDIGKEYKMGWDTAGEWTILYVILGIHAIFMVLLTAVCGGVLRQLRKMTQEKTLEGKDEIVFVAAQYVGIICGSIGLAVVFLGLFVSKNVTVTVYHSVSATVMILVPYGLIVSYWLIINMKHTIRNWYDEKQWRDVTRAGFATLLLLIPAMIFFFIAVSLRNQHFSTQVLWFPFVLFTILFLFSLLTLINYRRS